MFQWFLGPKLAATIITFGKKYVNCIIQQANTCIHMKPTVVKIVVKCIPNKSSWSRWYWKYDFLKIAIEISEPLAINCAFITGVVPGDKIRRALGPMARKLACGPSKLTQSGPAGDSNTVISLINEIRKSGPLKDCEGPQKYDIKGPDGPWQILLILTPGCIYNKCMLNSRRAHMIA